MIYATISSCRSTNDWKEVTLHNFEISRFTCPRRIVFDDERCDVSSHKTKTFSTCYMYIKLRYMNISAYLQCNDGIDE